MKKLLLSLVAVLMSTFTYADGWEKATEIAVDDVVVLAVDNGSVTKELSEITTTGTTIGVAADYSGTPAGTYPLTVVAGSAEGSFAFQNADGAYLAWASGNSLTTSETLDAASSWTVTYANGKWDIYNVGTFERKLQYNASSPRFACYRNSGQTAVDLWKQLAEDVVAKPTLPASASFAGSYSVEITAEEGAAIYYTTDGTDPTTESTLYKSVLTITETTTVKAIAVLGEKSSGVAEATYSVITLGTIADAAAAENGTTCYVQGTVIATAAAGMLVQDETGIIYYYNTAGVPAKQGDVVTILGKIGQYGGKNQFASDAQVAVVGSAALAHPAAAIMDGAALEAWATGEEQPIQWATLTGTLAISDGKYYNITVEGTTTMTLSLVKPLQAAVDGAITVSGYLAYVNKTYAYMVPVDIQQAVTEGAQVTANNMIYQIVSTNKILNGSFDNGVVDWYATNYETAAVPTNFTWNPEGGFDGGAYITYSAEGVGSAKTPRISAAVEAGKTYLFQAYTQGTIDEKNKQYNALKYAGDSNGEGATIGMLNWGSSDSWTVTNIVFTPEEDTFVRLRSSWTSSTGLDGVALYEVQYVGVSTADLEAAIAAAQATIDNKEGVGTGLFQIAESALEAYQTAVNTAKELAAKEGITLEEVQNGIKALEDAKKVYQATVNTPAEGVGYSIQQKASGLYLSLNESGVVLAAEPQALSWEAAEGGWYITDGTYYVGLEGTDNWTMSSAADKKMVINPSVTEIEGIVYYTLNEVKGMIATDATEAGSACYADKSVAKSGDKAYWSFAEYIEPVVPEETVSVFFANASDNPCGTLSTRSEDKTTLTTLDASGLAGVTLTAGAFDQATWFSARCLSIKPSAAKTAEKVTITAPEGYIIDSYVINAFTVSTAYAPYLIDFNEEYTGQDVPAAMTEFPEVKVNASSASFWIYCNAETVANWMGVSKFMVKLKKAGEATTYAINIAEGIENGTVVADKETAAADETVALTITPDEGYELDALSVISSEGAVIEVTDNTFTMPAAEVQVSATFKEAGPDVYIETDLTAQFLGLVKASTWTSGNASACGETTWAAPQVTVAGKKYALIENYVEGQTVKQATGDVMYNTITGLAPGKYTIELYGSAALTAGRSDMTTDFTEGDEASLKAVYLYAEASGEKTTTYIPCLIETNFNNRGGEESIPTAKLEGVVVGEDGKIKIGLYKEVGLTNWHIVQLKSVSALVNASDLLKKANADYEAIKDKDMQASVKETMVAAKAAAEADLTAETIGAYTAAIGDAQQSVVAYENAADALPAMKELVDATNVYTDEAYANYYGTWAEAFNAKTLTTEEGNALQNPTVITGWHASVTVDNFLLSAWDAAPDDFDNAPYHINTWSTEGETDGSEFKVPFFEYWVADANSLAERTLTATMNGLEAGYYDVTAWVRVRAKNGVAAADATGIALAVNDGEAIDVTEGTVLEGTQFALAEFTARGVVGEDGILKITFNVAADNNISWLSFKNVKYVKRDITDINYENALAQIKDGNFYQVTSTVGETTYYLTGEGKLTADAEAATSFEFKAVEGTTFFKPVGWNLGYRFTNPNLTNGSTGDVKNDGYIRTDAKNDRDDFERQVFFFDGENYAVRSTNATGSNWGANTYWDVIEGAELPTAGYSLEMQYKWNLVDVTASKALDALKAEIAATNVIVEAREGVGPNLFQKSEEDLAALASAAQTAQGVADDAEATVIDIQDARADLAKANETYKNAGNAPAADKKYMLQQKASGMYLALNESGVVLAEEPYALSWEVAETGGWYLTDGTYYVGLAGTNNWTMSSAADKKMAVNPSVTEIEGVVYYTLNEVKGMIATDGTDAGSACYADKSVAKSGDKAYWSIAEYEIPAITFAVTPNIQGGTKDAFTVVEAGTAFKLAVTAKNLKAHGYAPEDLTIKITMFMAGRFTDKGFAMGTNEMPPYTKQGLEFPYAEEITLAEDVFGTEYPYIQRINIVGISLMKGDEVVATIEAPIVIPFIEVYENGAPVGIKAVKSAAEGATIYDLSGRKVEKLQKGGVYIINGKKVSVK